ncbi:Feline leukemia virus subgroup C receptor- protein 2 [Branchiostoma belcheri]|nr:Feline leukemia virus subgroup C receptor- protein 2 [Branchiostoma belcheri]
MSTDSTQGEEKTGGITSESAPTDPTGSSPPAPGEDSPGSPRTKLYLRRWFMLLLFSSYSLSNAFQWIHYSVISNIVVRYYNVSILAVDWLSMVYMLAYIPLIFPATWTLDRKKPPTKILATGMGPVTSLWQYSYLGRYGLRVVGLLGSSLNCIGAWLKVAGVGRERFAVTMFAQTVCSVAQIFILGMPARVAAVWFGPREVSTATAIGVFGNQVGVALGFLIPPELVPNAADIAVVERGMNVMMFGTAGVTTLLFILVIVCKYGHPKTRQHSGVDGMFGWWFPGVWKLVGSWLATDAEYSYLGSIKRLMKSVPFVLLVITYGINTGSFYAISTLLNQVVLSKYPGEEVNVGRIGLTIVLTGLLGSVLCGIWLDRTRTFKGTTVVVYILSFLCMTAFTFTLDLGYLAIIFVTAGALGFFMTGYLPLGFEFAAEITYPESEGTSSGLLNASAQTFGIALTLFTGYLVNNLSTLAGNLCLCVTLFLGVVVTAFIKSDLKRLRAQQSVEDTNAESKTTVL